MLGKKRAKIKIIIGRGGLVVIQNEIFRSHIALMEIDFVLRSKDEERKCINDLYRNILKQGMEEVKENKYVLKCRDKNEK